MLKYPTRQAEQEREAELMEQYLAEGFTENQAERMAEEAVQIEQHGETADDAWDRRHAYRDDQQ